jgi:hypothetical protein
MLVNNKKSYNYNYNYKKKKIFVAFKNWNFKLFISFFALKTSKATLKKKRFKFNLT